MEKHSKIGIIWLLSDIFSMFIATAKAYQIEFSYSVEDIHFTHSLIGRTMDATINAISSGAGGCQLMGLQSTIIITPSYLSIFKQLIILTQGIYFSQQPNLRNLGFSVSLSI